MRFLFKFLKVGVIISKKNIKFIEKEGELLQKNNTLLIKSIYQNNIKLAFNFLVQKNIDVLWIYPDYKLLSKKSNFGVILEESYKEKIPIIAPRGFFVKQGAFLSVYSDFGGVGNQAAVMAKKLFLGQKKLGVHYPASTRVACNITTAKKIGMKLNKDFTELCDEIYQ